MDAKVIGNVYETKSYDEFHRLKDNRDVLENRIGKLIASMSERYICNPIIVNEKMQVIDGQGRFEARKSLGLPIHYIIVPGTTSDDCRRMNKYNSIWTVLDFAKSYAKKGLKSYQLLLRACKMTGLPINTVLRLSNHGERSSTGKANATSVYERGQLNFTDEEYVMILDIAEKADQIIEALQFTGRVNDAFRTGVKVMCETDGYDHSRMLGKCEKERSTYVQMSRLKDQLVEFERIYNKGAKNRKLYFSDYMRNRGSFVREYTNFRKIAYDGKDMSTLS